MCHDVYESHASIFSSHFCISSPTPNHKPKPICYIKIVKEQNVNNLEPMMNSTFRDCYTAYLVILQHISRNKQTPYPWIHRLVLETLWKLSCSCKPKSVRCDMWPIIDLYRSGLVKTKREWFGQLVQQHRGGGTRIFLNNSFNELIDKIIYRGNCMFRMFFVLTK